MTFDDAMFETTLEDACRTMHLGDEVTAYVMASHRASDGKLLREMLARNCDVYGYVKCRLAIREGLTGHDVFHIVDRDDRMTSTVVGLISDSIARDESARDCPENLLAEVCQAFRQAVLLAFVKLDLDKTSLADFEVLNPTPDA